MIEFIIAGTFEMIDKKLKQAVAPPIVGLVIAFILLYIYQSIIDWFYYPPDGDEVFSFDFVDYIVIYLASFFPIFIIVGLFQFFIAIPIWENYKRGRRFMGIHLWQLVFIASVIFGISITFLLKRETTSFNNLGLTILTAIIITMCYWIGNIYILKKIDNDI